MITGYTQTSDGNLVTVTVTSSLSGTIYYHWWRDGEYCGMTQVPRSTFYVAHLQQATVTAVDTNDPDYDYAAAAPTIHASTRTLYWTASTDAVAYYLVEQQQDGGAWAELARVVPEAGQWDFHHTTSPLTDLANYAWRVTPVAPDGQEGSAVSIGSEAVVRTPDAPRFTIGFDEGTGLVTFTEDS